MLPVLCILLLGFAELGIGLAWHMTIARSADVLADAAAIRMANDPTDAWRDGWEALAASEADVADCRDATWDLAFPDGGREAGQRVRVTWTCRYVPRLTSNVWADGTAVSVVGEAVIPFAPAQPTPSPSGSGD